MALKIKKFTSKKDIAGSRDGSVTFICPESESLAHLESLTGSLHPKNASLTCISAVINGYVDDDKVCGYVEISASYTLTANAMSQLQKKAANNGMKVRWEWDEELITISGNYKWESDGTPIKNKNILPTLKIVVIKCVVKGVKSSWDIGSITSLLGKVNSMEFSGAEPGTVLFIHPVAEQNSDGNIDLEYHLLYKPNGWNKFYREDTAGFDTPVKVGSSEPPYESADLSPLLS